MKLFVASLLLLSSSSSSSFFVNAQSCNGLTGGDCRRTDGCVFQQGRCFVPCTANGFQSTEGYGADDPNAFNLDLDLDLSSLETVQIYQVAYAKWMSIIRSDSNGGGSTPTSSLDAQYECPAGYPTSLDDLYICGRDICIDGPGSILGRAGPLYTWTATGLPATGIMEFDKDDVAALVADGRWEAVVVHEMGHIVGIGTLWDNFVDTNNDFIGPNAANVWQTEWNCSGLPPIETDGGPGTAGGHWDEDCLRTELMTGFLSGTNFLSKLSVAALRDIGYTTVDASAADDYTPPPECCNPARRGLRRRAAAGGVKGRPPLSPENRAKAETYGRGLLDRAKLPPGQAREKDGLTYVGDQAVTVLFLQDDIIYDIHVSANVTTDN